MIGSIMTYRGDEPKSLDSPDVARVLELFKQQNEVLKLALTTCVIIPEGTSIRSLDCKEVKSEN